MEDQFNEPTLKRSTLFEGHVIKVCLDQVGLPNGKTSQRELVFHNGGVGIIAITSEQKMVFVRQFRKALEKSILEIPAGKIEEGETNPLETAKREFEEETGYGCEEWVKVTDFVTSPGFCNETLYLYEARGLYPLKHPKPQDDDEFLELVELTLPQAKEQISLGNICDAKTLYSILYWELQQSQGA